MIFDVNNLFYHTGTTYAFTAGEFVSLVGITSSGTTSQVINMGVAQDLGIGDGEAIPKLAIIIGTAITSASSGMRINIQFQGSTDSSNWTTYAESGALATSAFAANSMVFPIDIPKRPAGAALPQYYRLSGAITGSTAETISSGTILAGIVMQRSDSADTLGLYPSGFSVAS